MTDSEHYSIHPAQLALRAVLEILAILAYGIWGWQLGAGMMAFINAMIVPGFVMFLWGVFNVPGDKSRSGDAVYAVKGWVRLLLELAVFAGAGLAMAATGKSGYAILFLSVTAIHYLTTLSRIKWLLRQ